MELFGQFELLVQFVGALAILAAFALMLLGRMRRQDWTYLLLNLGGSLLLTFDAWVVRQWGFVLLQAIWAIVAAGALFRKCAVGFGNARQS